MRRIILPLVVASAWLAPVSTHAQTPAPTPMPLPPSALTPSQPPVPPAAPEGQVTLNYPNNPLSDILVVYEQLTHKVLVRDANLNGPNLNIVGPPNMPTSKAITFIEASLLVNGYAFVPDGDNRLKIINTAGKNPRSEGIPIYASPNQIPLGDQIVSYFMQFRYLAAADAQAILAQHATLHTYGVLTPIPNAQALVITENASLIRQLVDLQELIDVPPARVMSEFIPLQRADAEKVAETITKLIEAQKNEKDKQHAAAAANPQQPAGAPGQPPAASNFQFENELVAGTVQLIPDARTNRILLITRPVNFPYIKGLIEEFDQGVGLADPLERPLKYVAAAEVLPVLSDLLTENEKGGGGGGAAAAANTPGQNRTQNQGTQNAGTNGSTTGAGAHPDELSESGDVGPTSVIVGKTRLIADNKANSILVFGPPDSKEKVSLILDRLDRRPPQVYLSTVIGELTLTKNSEFGVDYMKLFQSPSAVGNGQQNGIASSVINTANGLLNPSTLTTAAAFPTGAAGLALYGTVAKNVSFFVHALEGTNRFKVLARPVIYTANNKKAVISSGQRVAVPTSTLTNLNTTTSVNNTASVASNIDYEDVVLKLEVIPLINANNEVNLQIHQVDDSLAGSTTISGNTVPNIATQDVTTTVTVPNGNTVVLGGLITESETHNIQGIPILMHLPWVGPMFRDTTKKKERDELIILIQPNVVHGDKDVIVASQGEVNRAETGPESLRVSQGPLPPAEMQSYFPPKPQASQASGK